MSEEEKKELDNKLKQLTGGENWPRKGARCYCPASPKERRKKGDFSESPIDALLEMIQALEKKESENSESPSTTEEK